MLTHWEAGTKGGESPFSGEVIAVTCGRIAVMQRENRSDSRDYLKRYRENSQ